MNSRIAIVAVMTVLCGQFLIQGGGARAQNAQSLQSAPPADAALPSAATPPGRKAQSEARHAAAGGTVIRGGDTVSLIAALPWWRVDESRPPDPAQLESPILTACDLWLGFPFATADAQSLTVRLAAAQHASEIELTADRIKVADADELNELDMAAPVEPQSASHPWLSALLALLGGAVAAISAVRYLFI